MRKLRLNHEPLVDLEPADLAGLAGGATRDCTFDIEITIKGPCIFTGDPCISTLPVATVIKTVRS